MNETPEYSVVLSATGRSKVLSDTVRSLLPQVRLLERIILVLDTPSNATALPADERIQTIFFAGSNSAKRHLGTDLAPPSFLIIVL